MAKENTVGAALALAGKGHGYTPTPRIVRVTPTLAEKILENNRYNRPLKDGVVEKYARLMKAGLWRQNGDTIGITKEGDLLNGQHRLYAIMESETPVDMLIVEGLDPDVMPTIDTGRSRTMGDVLAIAGGKNTNIAASVLRWLWWYPKRRGNPSGATHMAVSHAELYEFATKHTDIEPRVVEVVATKQAKKFLPPSILAFVYLMAHRSDPTKAGAWLHMLDSGLGIDDERHPVHQLRNRMIANRGSNAKLPYIDVCALGVKSWNFLLTGKRTKTLVWRKDEEFPSFEKVEK